MFLSNSLDFFLFDCNISSKIKLCMNNVFTVDVFQTCTVHLNIYKTKNDS